jgi:hypothetical protein
MPTPAAIAAIALGLVGLAVMSSRRVLPDDQAGGQYDPETGLPYPDSTTGSAGGATYSPGVQRGPIYSPGGALLDPATGQPYGSTGTQQLDPATGMPYYPDDTTQYPLPGGTGSSGGTSGGSSGGATTATRTLQTQLRQLGYDAGPVDGVYGAATRAAVMQLQRDNGLTADGVVGPATARMIAAKMASFGGASGGNTGGASSSWEGDFGGFQHQRFGRPNPPPRRRNGPPPMRYSRY